MPERNVPDVLPQETLREYEEGRFRDAGMGKVHGFRTVIRPAHLFPQRYGDTKYLRQRKKG